MCAFVFISVVRMHTSIHPQTPPFPSSPLSHPSTHPTHRHVRPRGGQQRQSRGHGGQRQLGQPERHERRWQHLRHVPVLHLAALRVRWGVGVFVPGEARLVVLMYGYDVVSCLLCAACVYMYMYYLYSSTQIKKNKNSTTTTASGRGCGCTAPTRRAATWEGRRRVGPPA